MTSSEDIRDREYLIKIWKQKKVPVIFVPGKKGRLFVRLFPEQFAYSWIRGDHRSKPEWNDKFKCYDVPRNWLNKLIPRILGTYGILYLIQQFTETEICAPACWHAEGFDCVCSCLGKNHGSQVDEHNWIIVSEALAIRTGNKNYSCRILKRAKSEVLDDF